MSLALWALTIIAFAIGTAKFVIVGLVPTIADQPYQHKVASRDLRFGSVMV